MSPHVTKSPRSSPSVFASCNQRCSLGMRLVSTCTYRQCWVVSTCQQCRVVSASGIEELRTLSMEGESLYYNNSQRENNGLITDLCVTWSSFCLQLLWSLLVPYLSSGDAVIVWPSAGLHLFLGGRRGAGGGGGGAFTTTPFWKYPRSFMYMPSYIHITS